MKWTLVLLLGTMYAMAQKPCDFATNENDSTGTYRITHERLFYERNFAGNATYLFNSISVSDGLPALNLQLIDKSPEFIKAKCFDANSRVFLQLENGKVVTLLHIPRESCGTMVRDEKGLNNRILVGYFVFRKDDSEYLKTSPVSLMRIKFGTETIDYIIKGELKAELDGLTHTPATYFMDYFHCTQDDH